MIAKKTIDQVRILLQCNPRLRDDNAGLYAEFLYIYVYKKDERFFKVTIFDFLKGIEFHDAPSYETIARYSRMIQNKEPELRGQEYDKRHNKQEKVKKDLGYK